MIEAPDFKLNSGPGFSLAFTVQRKECCPRYYREPWAVGRGPSGCRLPGGDRHTVPCCTHLCYFSWGDLPFVGASEHTGDIPVGAQDEQHWCLGLLSQPALVLGGE